MDSDSDTACAVGCPIRKSRDQRLLASPPGLSQRATSFIASQCQGIHQMPFVSRLSTTPNGKYQNCIAAEPPTVVRQSLLKTHVRIRTSSLTSSLRLEHRHAGRIRLGHTRLFTLQSTNRSESAGAPALRMELHAEWRQWRARVAALAHQNGANQIGGGERDRTDDLLLAKQALSQLSYTPVPDRRRRSPEYRISAFRLWRVLHC